MKNDKLDELDGLIDKMAQEIRRLRVENNELKNITTRAQESNTNLLTLQKQNIELLMIANKNLDNKVRSLEIELKKLEESKHEHT